MKYKRIMLGALVLLAILTIGAVSASDDGGELAAAEVGGDDSSIAESPAYDSETLGNWTETESDPQVVINGSGTDDGGDGSGDEIHVGIWDEDDERGTLYTDTADGDIVSMDVPPEIEGTIFIFVNDDLKSSWIIEHEDEGNWEYHEWNLENLEMTEANTYNVVVKYGDETVGSGEVQVVEWDENSFRVDVNYEDGIAFELFCPANSTGTAVIVIRNEDDEIVNEITHEITSEDFNNRISWSISDFGLDSDRSYHFELNVDEFSYAKWFYWNDGNNGDNEIGVGIWDENDERGTLYTDSEGYVVSLYVPRSYEGNVFRIYVNGNEAVFWEAEFDGDNEWEYKDWGLEDLGIAEAGDYNIVVISDNGEDNEILLNTTINVSEFEEEDFRAMILYAQEVIKFYTPQDGEGTLTIVTEKEVGGDRTEEIFDESYEITDEYRGNWKEFALEDLGFEADGAFRIFTLTVTNATGDEVYRYRISHVAGEDEEYGDGYMEKIEFAFNSDEDDEEIIFNKTSDVLVAWLYIPDIVSQSYNPDTGEYEDYYEYEDVSATVYVSLNGELIKTVSTSNFTQPLDRPNHYPIILDLAGLKDKDMLTFRVEAIHENTGESAIDEEENEWLVVVEDKGDYVIFHDDVDFERLEFSVFAGNLTLGTTNDPDLMGVIKYNLVIVTISDALDINEGTITVSDGKSTIFTKQLSECHKEYDYGSAGYGYYLSLDDVKDILPEGKNLTVSFNYADNTLSQKRIRFGDYLYAVVTVEDINNQYRFEISDDVMLHETDTAIHLVSDTNRQAILFDLGQGYFTVYVNDVKVENLGIISYNTWKDNANWREDDWDYVNNYLPNEEAFLNYVASYWGSELELFRLTSWTQGAPEIDITLADLGITESGTYNIRITHYPTVPGGPDDHSALGIETTYAGETLIPTVTEVLNTTITCNFNPDYAGVNIYPVTIYGNGIPFLFTFDFGDNILSQSNRVLIYVDGELAFNSTILYYDENDEGEMELVNLWIVGPEMLNEDLFDEYGLLDVGEYEAVVYLVKGDDDPVEIGRGDFSRIKQRGDMDFTIGSSVEDDGVHTILYADIPEGNWTDYTLEINIADSEGVYPAPGDELWVYWFNEYVIFKDDDIYFKDSLEDIIGKGPVAIDLGVLENGTRIFVALEHGEETVFGDWDFYHNGFIVGSQKASEIAVSNDILFDFNETGSANVTLVGASDVVANVVGHDEAIVTFDNGIITVSGLEAGNYTLNITTVPEEGYTVVSKLVAITVNKIDANMTVEVSDVNADEEATIFIKLRGFGNIRVKVGENYYTVTAINGIAYLIIYPEPGTYGVNARFEGDNNINPAEANATFTVAKRISSVAVDVESAYNVGDEIVISINSTANVTVVINNKTYEVKDGKVIIDSAELGTGTFMVVATIAGDDSTEGSSANATFTISLIPTEIVVANETFNLYPNDWVEDVASLNPADAGDLTFSSSDENVVLAVDGVIFANSTGTATVTVSFAGTDKYAAAESKTITVNVMLKDASVSVENDTLDLKVDDRYDLNATASSKALNIQYVSSDESVATVTDYGIVTAVGEGTAIITLTVGNDVTFAVNSTNVTVKVSKIPTEITVASPVGEFSAGAMGHVAAELVPSEAGELSYASNDTSVVNVSSTGVIKANGAGTALITVSFAGNDKYAAAESKTITVTVSPKDASVNVSKTSYALNVGDNDTIVAVSVPADLKVNFETDDDSVVSVDGQGNIVALGVGKATVFVSVGDNVVYKYDSVAVDVTVTAKNLPKTITKDTFNSYFDKNGVYVADLDEITFVGEFAGIDALTFNKPVAITGQNAVFNNVSFNINADNVSVKGITFNNAAADYVINASASNGLSLIGNTFNAVNGILISDSQDFTVDSNTITSVSGVNINGIYITGTAGGIVKNNNLNLKSEKTAYAINTNPTGPFKVSYINNSIYAESYFAVGIYDDSEVIRDNNITLICNYGAGIVVLSDNTTVDNNDVSVNASNEGSEEIPDENVNETSGIVVKANAEITNNNVESTAKSISVLEGSSTISDNQLVGSVSVQSNENTISGNTIVTEEEYAIDLGNSSGNTITDNELHAGESQGSEAINAGNGSNDISGNDIKNSTFDVTGPVEFDYNASGSTEIVNLTGASNVTAFVVDHPEAAVTVDGAKVTVSGLNPGSYTLNITTVPDKGYSASSKLVEVTVNKVKAPVGNDTFNFDENKTVESKTPTYSITLPSDATGNLTVTIGTKTYTKALVNGTATIVVDDLPAGNYDVTIAYSGDSKYSAIVKTSKATVKVDPKIVAKDATVQYNAGKYYSATVYGDDGKLASGITVTFTLNGKKIATAKTGTNGIAKFKVTQTPVTKGKLVISALGVSVTKKLTVKHLVTLKTVKVKKSAKKLVLQATLAKLNGKVLKNKKITFKFNGKKYTAKTNKKGVAKVTVKSSVLKKLKVGKKVTYQATYIKDTVKKTVKVKK